MKKHLKNPLGLFEVADPNEPEWLRVKPCSNKFGLSRSHLFLKCADGTLEHRHLVRPGKKRGILLIRASSVRLYINSFETRAREAAATV